MIRNIFLAFACILLTACYQDVAKLPKYDSSIDYASNKALIIVKINNFDYLDLSRVQRIEKNEQLDEQHGFEKDKIITQNSQAIDADPTRRIAQINKLDLRKLIAKNADKNQKKKMLVANDYRILKPNRLLKIYSYADAIYVIEPGIYYISFLAIENADNIYYTAAPGLKNNNIMYGAFDIKPGEVLYLGDIECQWKSGNILKKITILDQMADVKEDLINAGKQDLAFKIQRAQFYQRGSQVNRNEDGTYTLIAAR